MKIKKYIPLIINLIVIIVIGIINFIKPWDIPRNLYEAVDYGNIKYTKKFIEKGIDVNSLNKEGWAPLHLTTLNLTKRNRAHIEIAKILIKAGADVNIISEGGDTPLTYTLICFDNKEKYETLYNMGVEMAKLLIKSGATVYTSVENKRLAKIDINYFDLIVSDNVYEVVKSCLENKETAGITQKDLNKALRIAEKENYQELAELLRQYGGRKSNF